MINKSYTLLGFQSFGSLALFDEKENTSYFFTSVKSSANVKPFLPFSQLANRDRLFAITTTVGVLIVSDTCVGTMSDESNSPANNENLSVESKDKQEGEFGDSGSVTKKPRTDDAFDSQQDQGSEASKEGTERNSYLHASSERKEENPSVNEVGFQIEAEAAEDKGSRHTMEDAWVVLPDASLDFPGKLR